MLARFICIEGSEGVGKTTQVQKLTDFLRNLGFSVLQTKEPGTPHIPLTQELRKFVLDCQYEPYMTKNSRELLMQAIRSIHIEKLITPARMNYDFIIQDRGLLSNTAYGLACGNSIEFLEFLSTSIVQGDMYKFYDDVILLTGNVANNLEKAIHCKKEFESGDAMESRGVQFIEAANKYLLEFAPRFNAKFVDTTGKDIESVFSAIINSLGIRKHNGRYY